MWALQLLIIQKGMETVRRFQDWAGPAVWIMMLILAIYLCIKAGTFAFTSDIPMDVLLEKTKDAGVPGTPGSFGSLAAVAAIWVTYFAALYLNFCDFARYAPDKAALRKGTCDADDGGGARAHDSKRRHPRRSQGGDAIRCGKSAAQRGMWSVERVAEGGSEASGQRVRRLDRHLLPQDPAHRRLEAVEGAGHTQTRIALAQRTERSGHPAGVAAQIEGEVAVLKLADPGSPTLVQDRDNKGALYVLMPMRV